MGSVGVWFGAEPESGSWLGLSRARGLAGLEFIHITGLEFIRNLGLDFIRGSGIRVGPESGIVAGPVSGLRSVRDSIYGSLI